MACQSFPEANIALVGHDRAAVRFLCRTLHGAGYLTTAVYSIDQEVEEALRTTAPDLVVVDLDGLSPEPFEKLGVLTGCLLDECYLPVMVLSSIEGPVQEMRASAAGANDLLLKPLDLRQFLAHVYDLLEARYLSVRLNDARDALRHLLQRRNQELWRTHLETLDRLSRVAEIRDDITGGHTARVGALSALIARELALPEEEAELIKIAAPLHDLGKIAITDRILLKTSIFASEERQIMQEHASLGAELLSGGKSRVVQIAEQIAMYHHERWDGRGYPEGLSGLEIPIAARIVGAADAFDALTHRRPYKEACTTERALDVIRTERGRQFDPEVVEALVRVAGPGGAAQP